MKKFLAIYTGSHSAESRAEWNALSESARKEREQAGMQAWMNWGSENAGRIKDHGAPLGKTKQVDRSGVSDIKNNMTGYVIVEAETHEEAANLFLRHPHFSIFPGQGVEVMEILPMPGM